MRGSLPDFGVDSTPRNHGFGVGEVPRVEAATSLTGESQRLQSNPALARSIEHRFPYLDPLNHLQVELLRRYRNRREGEAGIERIQRGIHLSINGIAAGLRNTG